MIGSRSKHILIHGYTCSSSEMYSTRFFLKCQHYFSIYTKGAVFLRCFIILLNPLAMLSRELMG